MATKRNRVGRPNKEDSPLNDRQLMFCKEYLVDLNGTQAAIRAGYSVKTAEQLAYKMLCDPRIKLQIQKEMDKRAKRTDITADKVLQEIAKMAFANIKDYINFGTRKGIVRDENGNVGVDHIQIIDIKDSNELTEEQSAAISEVSLSAKGTLSFKLHDKKGSLELLGRHLKLFTDKIETTDKSTITVVMEGELGEWSE